MVDLLSEKDVTATAMFGVRNIGKTLIMRTRGTTLAPGVLKAAVSKGARLIHNEEAAFRKFELNPEDGQGKNCPISMAWVFPATRCAPWSRTGRPCVTEAAHVAADGCLHRLCRAGFT